jgi:hypothetical protein
MSEAKMTNSSDDKANLPADDAKAKMLAALAKKQKGQNTGKSSGPAGGSKVGAGQTAGAAPKMHRRKAGSA